MSSPTSSPEQRAASRPGAEPHPRGERLDRLDRLADLLDSRWRVPGTSIRFGLDGVASILPVAGDTATACVSAYLLWQAAHLGASKPVLLRMAANVGLDWAAGSVPVVGTVFDVGFKANRRNMRLLRRYFERQGE